MYLRRYRLIHLRTYDLFEDIAGDVVFFLPKKIDPSKTPLGKSVLNSTEED